MQCKLVRELEVAPGVMPPEFVTANAVARMRKRNMRMRPVLFWKVGTVFDLPDSFLLVRNGCALPLDDECRERCEMTDEEIAAAQQTYERTEKGIHPEDFNLYDNGIITGYDAAGNYIPGPNWHLLEEASDEAEAAEVVTSKGPE